jgi:hypothetical protein
MSYDINSAHHISCTPGTVGFVSGCNSVMFSKFMPLNSYGDVFMTKELNDKHVNFHRLPHQYPVIIASGASTTVTIVRRNE